MSSKFAVLVGNGFTLDFLDSHNKELHSSFPLKNFKSSKIQYGTFIDHLPMIKNELMNQNLSDFDSIEKYASKYELISHEHEQLRKFLAYAYSKFQITVDDNYSFSNWRWVKWLSENKENLICGISFNYDLTLERAFENAGIKFSRSGIREIKGKVPIMKPHGSIDFDLPNNTILSPFLNRFANTTFMNDTKKLISIPKPLWLMPRVEADLIPPSLSNYQKKLNWVKTTSKEYENRVQEIEKFVIIGVSYWEVDRPEIDFYLEQLSKNTVIYIADYCPNKDLKNKIIELGLSYKTCHEHMPW